MPIIYNPYHSQETLAQYKASLQSNEDHREMLNTIKNNSVKSEKSKKQYMQTMSDEFNKTRQELQNTMSQNALDIVASNEVVNNTLEYGFERIDESLHSMGEALYSIDSSLGTIDASLGIIITQFRISNLLQENIADLLRIPDSEKERQSYLENAFKHIKNGLFSDALENLLYVERIKTDKGLREDNFLVLFHIGFLLLYNSEILDVEKAFQYFEKTCKYALTETDDKAMRLANILVGSPSEQKLSDNIISTSDMKKLSAEYCYHAAFAAYLLGEFDKSIEYCKQTIQLDPHYFSKASFLQAKSMSANNEESLAISVLEPILRKEPILSIKVSLDGDLNSKKEVITLLTTLKVEFLNKAKDLAKKLKIKFESINNKFEKLSTNELQIKYIKPIIDQFAKINHLIEQETYLDSRLAINLMDENFKLDINSYKTLAKDYFKALKLKSELDILVLKLDKYNNEISFFDDEEKLVTSKMKQFESMKAVKRGLMAKTVKIILIPLSYLILFALGLFIIAIIWGRGSLNILHGLLVVFLTMLSFYVAYIIVVSISKKLSEWEKKAIEPNKIKFERHLDHKTLLSSKKKTEARISELKDYLKSISDDIFNLL